MWVINLNFLKRRSIVLTHLIKKAEFLYYRGLSIIYGNDKSKTWKLVNEISYGKRKKGCSITALLNKDGIRC